MRLIDLVKRNFAYRLKTVAAVAAASALTGAVLTGALLARDSVSGSLDRIVARRLGSIEYAAETGDRFFTQELAAGIDDGAVNAAAILANNGAVFPGGSGRSVTGVSIYGVDSRFWEFTPKTAQHRRPPAKGEAFINAKLAEDLSVTAGDTIIIRARDLDAVPGDAPLSGGFAQIAALRVTVKAVLASDELGDFSLRANQVPPANVFLNYEEIGRAHV